MGFNSFGFAALMTLEIQFKRNLIISMISMSSESHLGKMSKMVPSLPEYPCHHLSYDIKISKIDLRKLEISYHENWP